MKKLLSSIVLAAAVLSTGCATKASEPVQLTEQQTAYFEDAWFAYVETNYSLKYVLEIMSLLPKEEQRLILRKMAEEDKNPRRHANIEKVLAQY